MNLTARVVGFVIILGFLGSGVAAASTQSNTFELTGQVTGRFTLLPSFCMVGDTEAQKASGYEFITLNLTDHGTAPTTGSWEIKIQAKSLGTLRFPGGSPSTQVMLQVTGQKLKINQEHVWTAGGGAVGPQGKSPTGTVVIGSKSGTVNLTLVPESGTGATSSEKVVGSWSCA